MNKRTNEKIRMVGPMNKIMFMINYNEQLPIATIWRANINYEFNYMNKRLAFTLKKSRTKFEPKSEKY